MQWHPEPEADLKMETSWLEDFLALAESGVFSRAAEVRNITQPAFTRRIKKLEYSVGATLFDRSVHPIVLTKAGEDFRPVASEILRSLAHSRAQLRDQFASEDQVNIATLQSLAVSFLPNWLVTVYQPTSPPKVKVLADNFAGCLDAISSGAADLMLCYSNSKIPTFDQDAPFLSKLIAHDVLIPISKADTRGRAIFSLDDPKIPFVKYSDMSFLGRLTNLIIQDTPFQKALVPTYENSIAEALKAAISEELGIAWVPKQLVEEELSSGKFIQLGDEHTAPLGITVYRTANSVRRDIVKLWLKLEDS